MISDKDAMRVMHLIEEENILIDSLVAYEAECDKASAKECKEEIKWVKRRIDFYMKKTFEESA